MPEDGGGEEGRTRRKNEWRRGPCKCHAIHASRFLRTLAGAAHSRVINAARTSILISKLTKLEIRVRGDSFWKRGNTLACHRCFAFCRGGFGTAQKGQCLLREQRSMQQPGPTSFRVALPRLNRGRVVTPRKIYLS